MKTNIYIPKRINVGFQNIRGTYTGKLAYIIYYDHTGKLRKEQSWDNWRDKSIPNQEFENEPTSGFVLNKKVGDYCDHYHRQAYCRIYDPRGFEFEIDINNLLWILENADCIKGKGLTGEFIYGWNGKDLLLIPCDSPDYKEMKQYTDSVEKFKPIKMGELQIGAEYKTSDGEAIYLGRFPVYNLISKASDGRRHGYLYEQPLCFHRTDLLSSNPKRKYYWFANKSYFNDNRLYIQAYCSKVIKTKTNDRSTRYEEAIHKMECSPLFCPIDDLRDNYHCLSFERFKELIDNNCRLDIGWANTIAKFRYGFEYIYVGEECQYDKHKKPYERIGSKYYYSTYGGARNYFNSLEELYDFVCPVQIEQYLTNGNLYRREPNYGE